MCEDAKVSLNGVIYRTHDPNNIDPTASRVSLAVPPQKCYRFDIQDNPTPIYLVTNSVLLHNGTGINKFKRFNSKTHTICMHFS